MRIHHVDGHLHSVEVKCMLVCRLKHAQMHAGILVASEADLADCAGLLCLLNSLDRATRGEDYIWIVKANDLMELQEINHFGLQTSQRLLNLPGRGVLIPPIDLCHQEYLLSIAIAERLAHPYLTDAAVVIPAVVHEGDTAIDCSTK
jgi:hypothetical protein